MTTMCLIDLVKAVSSMGLSQSELDLVISARNVVYYYASLFFVIATPVHISDIQKNILSA